MKHVLAAISVVIVGVIPVVSSAVGARATGTEDPFSQSRFIPDISLIFDFSAATRNLSNTELNAVEVPGLIHARREEEGHGHVHAPMNAENGFNFNYAELSLYSSVDPYFDLHAAFHLSEASFEVEEAYLITRSLPRGLQLKAGKFLSSFGRLNEQHAHYWDFSNAPLVYRAFLGEHNLMEKGMRLTWLAPARLYLMFGGEVLCGENENSFGTGGFTDATGTHSVSEGSGAGLVVGYVKTSLDVGETSLLAGGSVARGATRTNHGVDDEDNPEGHGVYGRTTLVGGDLTLKHPFDSYRYVSLQTEYLHRRVRGDRFDAVGGSLPLVKTQSGLYSQFLLRLAQRWRLGFRYDLIADNRVTVGSSDSTLPEDLASYSAMVEFSPSEFARLRLQYTHDRSLYLDEGLTQTRDNELILEVNMAIGAHGAHSF